MKVKNKIIKEIYKKAKKYKTRKEFISKDRKLYNKAIYFNILKKVCKNMKPIRNNWDFRSLKMEAAKYKKRSEMKVKNSGAYKAALKLSLMDKIFPHCPPRKLITPFLNKTIVLKEALKYNRKVDFSRKAQVYYNYAMKNGFLKQATKHMIQIGEKGRIPPLKWTKENLKREALKHKKRSHFLKKSSGAYEAAVKMGILNQICSHMEYGNKKKWTEESLIKEAAKYKNKLEFTKKRPGAIKSAYDLGIIDKICKHMPSFEDQIRKFTKEEVLKEALKYETRIDFATFSKGAYSSAKYNNWIEEVCSHMVPLQKRIEEKTLHPKIIKILKNKGFKQNHTFFHHKRFNNQIPDFIVFYKDYLLVIEAKTCATHINRKVFSEYEKQVQLQKKEALKKYPDKKIVNILVSEFGSIKVNSSNYNLSLKTLGSFLDILKTKELNSVNKKLLKKQDMISKTKLEKISFKIRKNFEEKYVIINKRKASKK